MCSKLPDIPSFLNSNETTKFLPTPTPAVVVIARIRSAKKGLYLSTSSANCAKVGCQGSKGLPARKFLGSPSAAIRPATVVGRSLVVLILAVLKWSVTWPSWSNADMSRTGSAGVTWSRSDQRSTVMRSSTWGAAAL